MRYDSDEGLDSPLRRRLDIVMRSQLHASKIKTKINYTKILENFASQTLRRDEGGRENVKEVF